ncbi:MAG TPA: aldo/keto reductase [Longimicrobiales bacterium]|nr:aldo/keto reductase [Longimicrobiales bacterium]
MTRPDPRTTTRRDAIKLGLLAGAGLAVGGPSPLFGRVPSRAQELITRPIPGTDERLPVVGVGTNQWGAQTEAEIAPLREIVRVMNEGGARFIDTARIYGRGRAEEVIGRILRELDLRDDIFIATKVPTPETREQAVASLEGCMTALGVEQVSAMRVHFLDGVDIVLPILREWKEAGRIRYLGVTTMSAEQYPELERLIREEDLDMIEIDYSVLDRAAADRILPLAADHGVAVVVARPFAGGRGGVFSLVGGRPLPDFAAEIGATSWAQLCLKYNLANPAVTVVIPGTDDPEHMVDNLGAGRGELPDADLRRRIEGVFDELGR